MEVKIDREQIKLDQVKAKIERIINKGTFVEKQGNDIFYVYFSITSKDVERLKKHFPKMKVHKVLFNISKIDLKYDSKEENINNIVLINKSKARIIQEKNNRDKEDKIDRFGMRF